MISNTYLIYANEISANPIKFAPLNEVKKGQTVLLDLAFKEFYTGRSALGVLFEDFEGLHYRMKLDDFETVLKEGKLCTNFWKNSFPKQVLRVRGEFKVIKRSGYHFIEMVIS